MERMIGSMLGEDVWEEKKRLCSLTFKNKNSTDSF